MAKILKTSGTNNMKTIIFCMALLFGSWMVVADAAPSFFYNSQAEAWVEQNQDRFAPESVARCMSFIGIGQKAIEMRDEGMTLKSAIADLNNSRKLVEKEKGARMLQPIYLEFSRMIYTVFRHPEMDLEQYNHQFFAECMALGGY